MFVDIIIYLNIISCIVILFLVTMQPSKGSDLGSMAGGTNSTKSNLYIDPATKIIGFFVLIFIISSFLISYNDNNKQTNSIFDNKQIIENKKTENINKENNNEIPFIQENIRKEDKID